MTGRLFDAFTNKTLSTDYSITVHQGLGGFQGKPPYEKLEIFSGNGQYYTGYFELFDLSPGPYIAIAESKGFINNFQRFYSLPVSTIKPMRAFPLVPNLDEGQIALVLTWGQATLRDLDIHVEFIASPNILCKCDLLMRSCGGVSYMTDQTSGGERGADVIKFDQVGDYQYLVYVSMFKHQLSPKAPNSSNYADFALSESQA